MKNTSADRTRHAALRLLARREHSKTELHQKLSQKKHAPDNIRATLHALAESDLQSDQRFAESFTRSRQARGQGPLRIMGELRARGIADEIIEEVVNITDNAWFTLAHEVWRRQFKGKPPLTPTDRAKQTRFLYYRGFSRDHINSLMKDHYDDKDQHPD